MTAVQRRMPVGAEVAPVGVHFRVWAPRCKKVSIHLEGAPQPQGITLQREENGYFSGTCPVARAGTRYRFLLDDKESYPDPASRFQPEGPHGPSQVVAPDSFPWSDAGWHGIEPEGTSYTRSMSGPSPWRGPGRRRKTSSLRCGTWASPWSR